MDCAGVPVISMMTAPIYLYDVADTSDMVARDQLQTVANTFIQIVDRLDRMSAGEIVQQLAPATPASPSTGGGGLGAPSTGSGGLLGERGSSLPTWCYALLAGSTLLIIMGGLAGQWRARSRR
jgi:hypothetical protein